MHFRKGPAAAGREDDLGIALVICASRRILDLNLQDVLVDTTPA